MYTTPDEDRSDLFLAGAVYFIGPAILGIILQGVSLPPAPAAILGLVVIVSTTILVPALLMRYRKERVSAYGFAGAKSALLPGFVAALPLAAAVVLGNVVAGHPPLTGLPVFDAVSSGTYVDVALQILAGFCVVLLAVYTTVKARTAFRSDPRYIRPTMLQLARIVAIIAAVAAALLFITLLLQGGPARQALLYLVIPLGVAGVVWLVHRGVPGSQLTSRPTLITPMVILSIAALQLFGGAFEIVSRLWSAALLAAIGLAVGVLLESHRSAWGPVGLGLGLVLFTSLIR